MVRTSYICPRCDWEAIRRSDMVKHFGRKRPCKNLNDLKLTDEIKKAVLEDFMYHPPKPETQTKITNNINYNNVLNNFIQGIDIDKKLRLLTDLDDYDYIGQKRLSFEDALDREYKYRNDKMERDAYRAPYMLDEIRLLDVIDNATKIDEKTLYKLNVLFDKAVNKIKVWMGKEWEAHAEEKGITQIVSYVKSYFLNNYELYLIKKLHQDGQTGFNPFEVTEHLKIYYRFLVPFRLKPCILDYEDREVLGHRLSESNDYVLAEKYMTIFSEQEKSLKRGDINKSKREILKIIKGNSVHNVSTLNTVIFDLIKVDEGFKAHIFGELGLE